MTEPHATTIAAAAGSISLLAGTVLGLPLPALVFGFAGGFVAVKLDSVPRTLWQRVTTIAMGTVCAAAWAPLIADLMRPEGGHPGMWVAGLAIGIGGGAEALFREFLQAAVARIRQIGGRDAS